MQKFYFTYGTSEKMPFIGGWTEVIAENEVRARQVFMLYHPSQDGSNILNCAFIYREAEFEKTSMFQNQNNMGHGCWERISLIHKEFKD